MSLLEVVLSVSSRCGHLHGVGVDERVQVLMFVGHVHPHGLWSAHQVSFRSIEST